MNWFKLIEHPPQPCGQLPRGSTALIPLWRGRLKAGGGGDVKVPKKMI